MLKYLNNFLLGKREILAEVEKLVFVKQLNNKQNYQTTNILIPKVIIITILCIFLFSSLFGISNSKIKTNQLNFTNRDQDCTLEISNASADSSNTYSFEVFITRNDPPWSNNTAIGNLFGSFYSTLVFSFPDSAFSNPVTTEIDSCISGTINEIVDGNLLSIDLISSGSTVPTSSTKLLSVDLQINDNTNNIGMLWSGVNTAIYKSDQNSYATLELLGDGTIWGYTNADFTANPQSGDIPLTVNFIDQSTPADSITSWQWDFNNDGTIDSYVQNPSYTYQDIGSYSVALTVTDINDSTDTETKIDYITVQSVSPEPPTNVTISQTGDIDITISWTASANANVYHVYRSNMPNSGFEWIGSTSNTSYTDYGSADDSKFFYYVTADFEAPASRPPKNVKDNR